MNDACITILIFNPLHALFAAVPCEHVLQNEPRGGNNPTFRTNSKIMSHPNPSLGYLSLTIQNDLATKCGITASQAHQAVALASPSHRWSSDQVDTKAQIQFIRSPRAQALARCHETLSNKISTTASMTGQEQCSNVQNKSPARIPGHAMRVLVRRRYLKRPRISILASA